MTDIISTLRIKIKRFIYRYKKYGIMHSLKAIVHDLETLFLVRIFVKIIFFPVRIVRGIHFKIKGVPLRRIHHIILYSLGKPVLKIFKLSVHQFFRLMVSFHPKLFSFSCIHADFIRKWRPSGQPLNIIKKKIVHITCSFDLGGTQRQILNLCEYSRDKGAGHQAIEIFPEQNYLYRRDITLENGRYVKGNYISRILGKWTLNPSFRSLQMLQVYKLVRDFETLRPDIAVGWGHEVAMITFLAASIARVPGIVFCIRTFNPSLGWTAIGPLLYKAHKKMLPYLDGIIVNSTQLQKDYSEWLNIPAEKVRVCPNGIEPTSVKPEEQRSFRTKIRKIFDIPDDVVLIINIGRFSQEKGQMLLVRAFHRLIDNCSQDKLYCMLCGDGPTQSSVEEYIHSHTLSNVIIPGRIDAIHEYLSAADIFVMPSDFEGMPNAMMEAMAYALPCISTNRSGATDIARDNREALFIDVGAVDQLYEKLEYLVENPVERKRLGENARERLKDFSILKMVSTFNNHLEDIYR